MLLNLRTTRSETRLERFSFTSTNRLIFRLLLLHLSLLLMERILPFTATASTRILTRELLSCITLLSRTGCLHLTVLVFFLGCLRVCRVTERTRERRSSLIVCTDSTLALNYCNLSNSILRREW